VSDWIDVERADALQPGEPATVELDDTTIAVFNVDGAYYAIQDVCTHDGEELTGGPVDGDQIICPRHGARFCLRTGAALTPPAYEPVHCFPVRIEGGVVQVRDDRFD
jgi:3-phenylpropionate/trans-cinnamate dioxygenase ferredoxin subunit